MTISADSHIVEPKELFVDLEARYGERAPRVRIGARESAEDGGGAAALFLDGFANRDFRGSGHRRGFYGVVSAAQLSLH